MNIKEYREAQENKGYSLFQALTVLSLLFQKDVNSIVFIEYEDGSRFKFNFKFKDENKKRFIDLEHLVSCL